MVSVGGRMMAYSEFEPQINNLWPLLTTYNWRYTPILVGVLNFVVRLIIVIGSELEDPFGDDVSLLIISDKKIYFYYVVLYLSSLNK